MSDNVFWISRAFPEVIVPQSIVSSFFRTFSEKRYRMSFAGTPPTMAYGSTSFVTTAPAPMTAP